MAKYSNIRTPAMFVPILDYAQSIGQIKYGGDNDDWNDIHLLNPSKDHKIDLSQYDLSGNDFIYDIDLNYYQMYDWICDSDGYIYIFLLGHLLFKNDAMVDIEFENEDGTWIQATERLSIVNYISHENKPLTNGFTVFKAKYSINQIFKIRIRVRGFSQSSNYDFFRLGCVSICSKWNPPQSPDLSVVMSREYDGIKNTKTKGGATLSSASHTRGTSWWASNTYGWELTSSNTDWDPTQNQVRSNLARQLGKRTWSMNFSYLSPSDIMPEIESLRNHETEFITEGATGSEQIPGKNIVQSQSFFSRVLNRVQGSHIPFIFLPDDTTPNYNPDQWAIVRFDQNKFPIRQTAPELYSMKLKLRESY